MPARRAFVALVLAAAVLSGQAVRAEDAPAPAPAPTDPYAGTPEELRPHRGAGEPLRRFFTEPPTYRGPGAEEPEPEGVTEVRLGVIVPLSGIDAPVGRRMRNGYELAVAEANAAGGYKPGVPFRLLEADENDTWGAAGNALVELTTHKGCWAVLGALDDSNSHVMTRVLLKINVPMMNTGGTDPTLTEHMIPWLVRVRPDDRQASYRLVKKVLVEDGRQRVAMFRANDRYARQGVGEFVDAARRLGKPPALEMRYTNDTTDFTKQVEQLKKVNPDAIVMWGRAAPTGRALAALRAAGVTAAVYGPDRLMDPEFLAAAGKAAEGVTITMPCDPTRKDPAWTSFQERYRAKFGADPDHHAAFSYEGAKFLMESIRKVGLNHARIRSALFEPKAIEAVVGTIRFDPNQNNITPVILARVVDGAFQFDVK